MRLFTLACVVSSSLALAQEVADAGVAPAPVVAPVPAVAAAPAASVTPAPPPLTVASVLETMLAYARPYATIKPTVIVEGAAVESFSQPNAVAITAAANPVLATAPTTPRMSFQVAQSRLGLWLNEKGAIRAQAEIDFIDYTKATPTVASLPRLRIAKIEWAPTEHFTLIAGQDWDLHAPVNPHGSNLVGARFQSGNVGYIRQQVKALGRVGNLELGAAIGMEGVNAAAKEAAFELSLVPTFAVRAAYLVGSNGRVGVSGLATSIIMGLGKTDQRRAFAGGATAFADVTFGRTTLRGELSVGQNMANIGMLSIGFGSLAHDMPEWGGFISVRHGFTDMHFIYANAGLMRVLDRVSVVPSYTSTTASDGVVTSALGTTGPGMLHNAGATLGYELRLSKNLGFLLEGFFMQTEFRLLDADAARLNPTRQAVGGELAAVVTF
jgi:uncharacterized membrane protein (GlpM family)